MDSSLRNRLTFGPIMLAALFALLWLDDRAQEWTSGRVTFHGQPVVCNGPPWGYAGVEGKESGARGATEGGEYLLFKDKERDAKPLWRVPLKRGDTVGFRTEAGQLLAVAGGETRPLEAGAYRWNVACGIGGIGILVLLTIILPIATVELAQLFAAEQVKPFRFIAAVGSGALIVHAFCTQFPRFQSKAASILAFIVVFTMLFAALRTAWAKRPQGAIHAMAGTVLATLYLGGLGWFLMALRVKHSSHFEGTTLKILMILLVVKFTDIGAFAGGKMFGRHKLIPWLSPGKTWEGLFFGLVTAGLIGSLCARWILDLTWGRAFVFGIVIGGVGQLGDLLESLMKRDAEVKDSGKLIPGFGGILDVIDSPLLAAPFAYLVFSLF